MVRMLLTKEKIAHRVVPRCEAIGYLEFVESIENESNIREFPNGRRLENKAPNMGNGTTPRHRINNTCPAATSV